MTLLLVSINADIIIFSSLIFFLFLKITVEKELTLTIKGKRNTLINLTLYTLAVFTFYSVELFSPLLLFLILLYLFIWILIFYKSKIFNSSSLYRIVKAVSFISNIKGKEIIYLYFNGISIRLTQTIIELY